MKIWEEMEMIAKSLWAALTEILLKITIARGLKYKTNEALCL